MFELTEFDYEFILKSYSVQDVALQQSSKQKQERYKLYEEKLEEYKEVRKEFMATEEERQLQYAKFVEQLNIKNSFNQMQTIPNNKINEIQEGITNIYQMMSNDSNDFVNSVDTCVKKFQNLATEFDDAVVLKNKQECTKKIQTLMQEIETRENKYKMLKAFQPPTEYSAAIHDLNKSINYDQFDLLQIKREISGNEQHLALLNKNIDFLKQRNYEFQMQCASFGN